MAINPYNQPKQPDVLGNLLGVVKTLTDLGVIESPQAEMMKQDRELKQQAFESEKEFNQKKLEQEKALTESKLLNDLKIEQMKAGRKSDTDYLGEEIKRLRLEKLQEPTPDQSKAAGFANRMLESNKVFDELANTGELPGSAAMIAQGSSLYPEVLKKENFKLLENQKKNFLTAQLRRESGASISPSELETGNALYFPQPGDSDKVLEQKRQNRENASLAMSMEAGSALQKLISNRGNGQKLNAPNKSGSLYDPFTSEANAGQQKISFSPDVTDYARKHGISNEEALKIKIMRSK